MQSEGGKAKGGRRTARGTALPPISTGSTALPKCLHLEVAGAAAFLISRQREPVICHAVSNCVEGAQKEARRRGGRAGVGWVMDNREACRWTGAPPPLDKPHMVTECK